MPLGRLSRRDFLVSSGTIGIGASVLSTVPGIAIRRPEQFRRILSIAVIGLDDLGPMFARAAQRSSDLVLSAICDFEADRVRRVSRALSKAPQSFTDPLELLDQSSVDIVILSKPANYASYDVAVHAAKSGKHLFFGEPFALDPPTAIRILTASRISNVMAEHSNISVPEKVFDELCRVRKQRHGRIQSADAFVTVNCGHRSDDKDVLSILDLSRRVVNVCLPKLVTATWTDSRGSSWAAALNYVGNRRVRLETRTGRTAGPAVSSHNIKFKTESGVVATSWNSLSPDEALLGSRLRRFAASIQQETSGNSMTPLSEAYLSILTLRMIHKSLEYGQPVCTRQFVKDWQIPDEYSKDL